MLSITSVHTYAPCFLSMVRLVTFSYAPWVSVGDCLSLVMTQTEFSIEAEDGECNADKNIVQKENIKCTTGVLGEPSEPDVDAS